MRTYILILLSTIAANISFSQSDTVLTTEEYDQFIEEVLYGTWYRKIAIYSNDKKDTCYKSYEFYPNNKIIMTEVRNGLVQVFDYCSYFVKDTCLYLVTHFKDTSFITDAANINHLDSSNFVVKSFFPGYYLDKTTFGIRRNERPIPDGTPAKKDDEMEMPGFAERKPILFS